MGKIKNSKTKPEKKLPKVVVIGMGYVGFPLACAIAKSGKYKTCGLELSQKKIDLIRQRISPVEDRQAEEDIKTVDLEVTDDESIIQGAKYILICVPTPIDEKTDNPDLTPVRKACEAISRNLGKNPKQHVILESSVYPGVCDKIVKPILEKSGLKAGQDFELAHCPERIDPGNPNWNVYNIARTVGGFTPKGTKTIAEFYRSFLNKGVELVEVGSPHEAELSKEIENTFRYINIAFSNLMAMGSDKMGIDYQRVLKAAGTKPFAFMKHYPGCGVGGHCLPKDTKQVRYILEQFGVDPAFLQKAIEINEGMPKYTVMKLAKVLRDMNIDIKGANIGLLGLSYKANLGDMRDSPALEIKKELVKLGANVLSCDPYCNGHADAKIDEILEKCIGVIIATNHECFLEIKNWKNVKAIVDGRNCLNKELILPKTVSYRGIGRGE